MLSLRDDVSLPVEVSTGTSSTIDARENSSAAVSLPRDKPSASLRRPRVAALVIVTLLWAWCTKTYFFDAGSGVGEPSMLQELTGGGASFDASSVSAAVDTAPQDGEIGSPSDAVVDAAVLSTSQCANFSVALFRAEVRRSNRRFMFMEPMRPGYGLTNQLMTYAGLILFAFEDSRSVVFPPARTHFRDIISLARSRLRPMVPAVTSPCEEAAANALPGMRMKDKRFFFLRKAMARGNIVNNPTQSTRKLYAFMRTVRQIPVVRVWDMYGRWPYGSAYARPWQTFPWFMCGIHFAERVERQTAIAYRELAELSLKFHQRNLSAAEAAEVRYPGTATVATYVAVHLRMEPQDMSTMGRSWSDEAQVAAFFNESVFPIARKHHTRTVLLCSGRLHPPVEHAIRSLASTLNFVIVRKTDFNVTVPAESSMTSESHGLVVRPTNSFGAIIDLLLMERAAAAVVTAFSSLTAAVYSRRCCTTFTEMGAANHSAADSAFEPFGGGAREGGVYLYDVYQDGTLTAPVEYPCGYQLEDYVVGRVIPQPPDRLRVFSANFNRSKPIYTEHARNDVPRRVPPNSTEFAPPPPPKKYVKVKRQIKKNMKGS
jgi:hypothetical protein